MQNNPDAAITKFRFGKLISAAWNKRAAFGNAVRGFECTGIIPFNPFGIPHDTFLFPQYFEQDSTDSLSSDTPNKSPVFNPETSYPSESSFLQLTSYLSVAGPFSITKHRVYSAERNNVGTIIPSL
jgi:hypothetical protein